MAALLAERLAQGGGSGQFRDACHRLPDGPYIDVVPVETITDKGGAAGGAGHKTWKAARHRLQRDVAEGLGH